MSYNEFVIQRLTRDLLKEVHMRGLRVKPAMTFNLQLKWMYL